MKQDDEKLFKPKREEYGEPDRPLPRDKVEQIKSKFVDWDLYKLTILKNRLQNSKRIKYLTMQ